jgi:hypothetical protein
VTRPTMSDHDRRVLFLIVGALLAVFIVMDVVALSHPSDLFFEISGVLLLVILTSALIMVRRLRARNRPDGPPS